MENITRSKWLTSLMERFEQRLLRYASRFVNLESAKDIVQDAFVRLWKEEEQKLSGREREWLFCVVRNLAIDQIRKHKKVRLLEEEGVSYPEAEVTIMFQQDMGEIRRFVSTLPVQQREVIRLKFQESMSYREIANITGYSTAHVGVLIHKGMTEIRKKMSQGRGSM